MSLAPRPDPELPERRRWQGLSPFVSGLAVGVATGHLFWPYVVHLLMKGAYTEALFFGVPAAMGFTASLFLGFRKRLPFNQSVLANLFGQLTLAAILLATRWEGIVCLAMSLPFTFCVGLLGSWLGWRLSNAIVDRRNRQVGMTVSFLIPIAILAAIPSEVRTASHKHVTERIISAPAARVWPSLLNLDRLPEPSEWVFRAGMAYPIGTSTKGLTRICDLSTGPMPERIEVFEVNRRLSFRVLDIPPALRETNPFGEVHAPHNIDAFRPTLGEFRLEALEGGRTKVVATTWYEHDYAPDLYWSLWTEAVVGSVHNRVLDEIERRATR